jgi:hypothetical protein
LRTTRREKLRLSLQLARRGVSWRFDVDPEAEVRSPPNPLWIEEHMETNTIVIVSLMSPKEKIWGQLLSLDAAGVTVRGIDLFSFDDFLRQLINHEEATVGPATVFYPMQRIERIAQDEACGIIPSLADRFRERIGLTVQEYLGLESAHL